MTNILTIIHVVVCFFLVVIVLLQQGKGANMGATFGGSSQTVFGSEGPQPLLSKVTTLAAITFMVTSLALAYISSHKSTSSVMKDLQVQKTQENAIEKPSEPLPQSGNPDMPLAPAANPAPQAAPVAAAAHGEVKKPVEAAAIPATPVQEKQEKVEAAAPLTSEDKPPVPVESKTDSKEK